MPAQKVKAAFTEPMLLLPSRELPEGAFQDHGTEASAVKLTGKS
jgi:hypothetical protein